MSGSLPGGLRAVMARVWPARRRRRAGVAGAAVSVATALIVVTACTVQPIPIGPLRIGPQAGQQGQQGQQVQPGGQQGPQAQPAQQALPVTVAKVGRGTLTSSVTYTATIQPKKQVNVLPRIAARIMRIPVEVGQEVKAGDLLAELDHTTTDAQIAQAMATVNVQRANLAAAQARLNTILAGPRPDDVAVAQAQLDAARVRLEQAQAGGRPEDIAVATSALENAKNRLAQVKAAGRPEDIRAQQARIEQAKAQLAAAEAQLQAARVRLDQVKTGPREEDVRAQQAVLDQAKTRLAQLTDAPKVRPEDLRAAEIEVQRQQANLDKARADLETLRARGVGSTQSGAAAATQEVFDQMVASAQATVRATEAALLAAQNNLEKLKNTSPTPWDLRLAELQVHQAMANLDKLRNVSPFDIKSAEAAVAQAEAAVAQQRAAVAVAEAQLDLMRAPTAFDVKAAEEAVNQAQANLEKLLKPNPFDVAAAQAAVDQAQANLNLRKQPYTENDRAAAEAAVAQARAAVEQAMAAVEIQRAALADAFITAPFDGIVADRLLTEGAISSANSPILTLISRDMEVVLNVEESVIGRIREGMEVTLTATAYPGERFDGVVSFIGLSADTRSRTFTVKVTPNDPARRLRPGMSVQVRLETERRENVLTVPRTAVLQRDNRSVVFVVSDGLAAMRQVTTGLFDDRVIEIVSGLHEGEDIVVSGQNVLRDKDPVRVVQPGQSGAGGQRSGQGGPQAGQQQGQQSPAQQRQGPPGQGGQPQGGQQPAGQGRSG
jgi:HlyD family secretion protein